MFDNKPPSHLLRRIQPPGTIAIFLALVSVLVLLFAGVTSASAEENVPPPSTDIKALMELEADEAAVGDDLFSAFAEPEPALMQSRPPAPAIVSTDGWILDTIPANDDGSSNLVALPFPINFQGNQYSALYVNNNGNVTFNTPMSTYTPFGLTGDTGTPIIAPFFADVDTRGTGSELVTYGVSPDGNQFVVNWVDVGYYSAQTDKLISAQLVLTKRSGVGFQDGDFDITFNYGSIGWETGSASGGIDGFGGTPVRAGYSVGTGVEGTFFELTGSGQTTALTDGGTRSLYSNSLNSLTTPGRYVFEMRADESGEVAGNVVGTVVDESAQPIVGAIVSIMSASGLWSSNTITGADGSYALSGLGTGPATVRVSPPSGVSLDAPAQSVTTAIGTPLNVDFILSGPSPIPVGTTVNQGSTQDSGIPSIYWDSSFELTHLAEAGASVTYEINQSGQILLSGDFEESAIAPGLYTTSVPSLLAAQASTGLAEVTIYVNGVPVTFDIYIDPAGTVINQDGQPIVGAEVIIYRSDSPDGPFEQIPDGSAMLSPSNRTNPDLTDAEGRFSWDTVPGYYQVSASAPNHLAADGSDLVWTEILPVPPEHLDLILTLHSTDTPDPDPDPDPTPDPGDRASGSSSSFFTFFGHLLASVAGLFSGIFTWAPALFSSSSS